MAHQHLFDCQGALEPRAERRARRVRRAGLRAAESAVSGRAAAPFRPATRFVSAGCRSRIDDEQRGHHCRSNDLPADGASHAGNHEAITVARSNVAGAVLPTRASSSESPPTRAASGLLGSTEIRSAAGTMIARLRAVAFPTDGCCSRPWFAANCADQRWRRLPTIHRCNVAARLRQSTAGSIVLESRSGHK